MEKIIKVGVADLKVTYCPNILTTLGLGSCVGVCLWDWRSKISGLAHIMLPSDDGGDFSLNPMKYADTAIDIELNEMLDLGADDESITAKIIGGAHMFSHVDNDFLQVDVGGKNLEAVKKKLKEASIRIVAEDTGGEHGRSIEFYSTTGKVAVRTTTRSVKEI
ncbi:MAG: chemotaxis protein CheD [Halobacteriota archaeon]|nr:chemotaxis protein CheD [Halobacteriota archaeon]